MTNLYLQKEWGVLMTDSSSEKTPQKKKFLGINFKCCNIYSRVYINKDGTAYDGGCPKCGKKVHVRIGTGGVDTRFFDAY